MMLDHQLWLIAKVFGIQTIRKYIGLMKLVTKATYTNSVIIEIIIYNLLFGQVYRFNQNKPSGV